MEIERSTAAFAEARQEFHAALLTGNVPSLSASDVPSNADKDNPTSVKYARHIAQNLRVETVMERLAGQTSGGKFETVTTEFLCNFPDPASITTRRLGHPQSQRARGCSSSLCV